MNTLLTLHDGITARVEKIGDLISPILARLIFASTLVLYFWKSGMTKLGEGLFGLFSPSIGAYSQIFPKKLEAAGYDVSQFGAFENTVVIAGTVAEFILPALIVLGLFTRLAALGMIGFVVVQSLTDVFGHNATDIKTLGMVFDRFPDGVILDQRLFWVFVLLVLVIKGGGALSLDALLRKKLAGPAPY